MMLLDEYLRILEKYPQRFIQKRGELWYELELKRVRYALAPKKLQPLQKG